MKPIQIRSPAKINLSLRVHERMPNGYHRLETAIVKLDFYDDLEIMLNDTNHFQVSVPGFRELENEKNLVIRAAKAYLSAAGLQKGARIHVTKRIPIGGGLGGGSGNAAAVLSALQKEFKALSDTKLMKIAGSLGADVPFFVQPATWAYAEGVGEILSPLQSFPALTVLLVNPGFPVSTPTAFKALQRPLTWRHPNGSSIRPENRSDLHRLLEIGNDLQSVVEEMFPEVKTIREELKKQGAYFAQMSGSGSTVFGLFDDEKRAKGAASRLGSKWKTIVTRTQ